MRRRIPWFEVVLCIAVLSAYVYAALSDAHNLPNRWFIRDDAYYYFKVAQNISEGHGSTFDGVHYTNGYHPLWLLVCVPIFALARYDLILPLRVLVLVTGLIQVSTALLLYRLIRSTISDIAAVLAAVYWVFNSYALVFLYKTGVESGIALLFIVLLLYLMHRFERGWNLVPITPAQLAILAAIAALAVFSRLDLVFFAVLIGLWVVLRGIPARYLLPLDLLALFVSALVAFALRLGITGYYAATTTALALIGLGCLIRIPVHYLFGLYSRPSTWRPLPLLFRLALSFVIGSAVTYLILFVASGLGLIPAVSRLILLIEAGISLGTFLLVRLMVFLFSRGRGGQSSEGMVSWPGWARILASAREELGANRRRWLKEGGIYYGILGGALALYMLWNKLTFGSLSPVSGQVKRWWGTFLISVYGSPAKTWLSFLTIDPYGEFDAWQPATIRLRDLLNNLFYSDGYRIGNPAWQLNYFWLVLAALFSVLLVLLLARRAATRAAMQAGMIPLFVGSWLQALSYNATGYAGPKEWYWLTEQVLIVMVAVLLISVVYRAALRRWDPVRLLGWTLVVVAAIWQGGLYWRDVFALHPYGREHDVPYAPVVTFLEEHTPPGAMIGMTGGGSVAYFIHDRTIVNMDGLINSNEYFAGLKSGTGSEYLYQTGMEFVFANPHILQANPYRGQYSRRLYGLATWGGKDLMKLLPDPTE